MSAGGADAIWLVADAGAGALGLSVVERIGGALHVLAHLRDRDLGGDALDRTIADELDVDGAAIDPGDGDWPALCRLARALKEAAAVDVVDELAGQLGRRVRLPDTSELAGWLAPRLRRVDELCQRALATSGVAAGALSDAWLLGGGGRLAGLAGRLEQALGRPPSVPAEPGGVVALGAAAAARMFLAEPAALFLDVAAHGLALSDGHGLDPLLAPGAVVPARARQAVATEDADQEQLTVELWEQGPRTRPYARYRIDGVPAAAAGDAIVTCDVLVDADLLPTLVARELASGAALAVTAVEEAALPASELAALREQVTAWRP
jgi:molecular chaperone HscA